MAYIMAKNQMETRERLLVKNVYAFMEVYWKRLYRQMMLNSPDAHTIEGIITWLATEGWSDCTEDVQDFIREVEKYLDEYQNIIIDELSPLKYIEMKFRL